MERGVKLQHVHHRLPIQGQDDVLDFQPRPFSGTSGRNVGDDHAVVLWQPQSRRQGRGDGLYGRADFLAMHVSLFAQLLVNAPHHTTGNGKAEAFISTAFRQDIRVLIPTTLPSISTSGPPLFPGLMGASVWMYTMGRSGSGWRAIELTTPMVTELPKPSGLPKANTNWPWRTSWYLPKGSDGRPLASILSKAKSVSGVHAQNARVHGGGLGAQGGVGRIAVLR